jgi:hypothetical protein
MQKEPKIMIGDEVFLNGKRFCLAGVGDTGVLSAILTWVNSRSIGHDLHVGGLANSEHLDWGKHELHVGDIVEVRVLNVATVDTPSRYIPVDPGDAEERERQEYERLKRKYGP